MTRLLTLVCFFHFSGLNNGFTYFVNSSAGIASPTFAPVAMMKLTVALNPFNWEKFISQGTWNKPLIRFKNIIEICSQKAVKNLLSESRLLVIWIDGVSESVETSVKSVHDPIPQEKTNLSSDLSSEQKQIIANADFHGTGEFTNYLSAKREELWFKFKKSDNLKRETYKTESFPKFLRAAKQSYVKQAREEAGIKMWVKNFIRFIHEKFRSKVNFISNRQGDEDSHSLNHIGSIMESVDFGSADFFCPPVDSHTVFPMSCRTNVRPYLSFRPSPLFLILWGMGLHLKVRAQRGILLLVFSVKDFSLRSK